MVTSLVADAPSMTSTNGSNENNNVTAVTGTIVAAAWFFRIVGRAKLFRPAAAVDEPPCKMAETIRDAMSSREKSCGWPLRDGESWWIRHSSGEPVVERHEGN